MTITAKYPATCSCCRQAITPGQQIEWAKGSPVKHAKCGIQPVAMPTRTMAPARSVRPARTSGKWTGCSCGSREDSYGDLIPSPRNCSSCEHDA